MASYLSEYKGAATARQDKFLRAVRSFIDNHHVSKELVIVSDGCRRTIDLYNTHFKKKYNVRLVEIEKQPLFSGSVRQAGVDAASGDVICFLDSDDRITSSHLGAIDYGFVETENDWLYYNDYIFTGQKKMALRTVELAHGMAGTSSIAYRRELPVSWVGCDGYGHDWTFIKRLVECSKKFSKIYGCGYHVCHNPNLGEC